MKNEKTQKRRERETETDRQTDRQTDRVGYIPFLSFVPFYLLIPLCLRSLWWILWLEMSTNLKTRSLETVALVSLLSLESEDQRKGIQASTLSWMRGKECGVFFQDKRRALCLPSGDMISLHFQALWNMLQGVSVCSRTVWALLAIQCSWKESMKTEESRDNVIFTNWRCVTILNQEICRYHFSNSICSLCVSVSHSEINRWAFGEGALTPRPWTTRELTLGSIK